MHFQPALRGRPRFPQGLVAGLQESAFCVRFNWAGIEEEEETSAELRSHNSQGVSRLLCGAHLSPTSSGFMQLPCLLGALPPNARHGIIYSASIG